MKVAVVKYNAGNVCSVINALKRLGVDPVVTDDSELLSKADRVVFPGQGEASTAMSYLRSRRLDEVIRNLRQPLLGICIGMQLLCRHSEEGDTDCLGVFDAPVRRFVPQRGNEKVPQMGWNELAVRDAMCKTDDGGLFRHLGDNPFVYFIHSFYVPLCEHTIGVTDYIHPFSAALHKNNFYATQFHPEKSGKVGEQILSNFLQINA